MEERLGILGGGAVACGLAEVAVASGHDVLVWTRSSESAARVEMKVGAGTAITTDLSRLAGSTFVVEAIAEDRGAKAELYAALPDAEGMLLATTTSSLGVSELARASGRPERFLALHVFTPVTRMALVELAFPPEAGDGVRERARALCGALGKEAVEVPDVPGFVVNRLLFPYLFGAVALAEETGLEPSEVDRAMKLGAGHPVGPLALLDLVGLDVAVSIGEALGIDVPARLRVLVDAGALGRKSGRGLLSYDV